MIIIYYDANIFLNKVISKLIAIILDTKEQHRLGKIILNQNFSSHRKIVF